MHYLVVKLGTNLVRMPSVRYGFTFKIDGQEQTTMYAPYVNEAIEDALMSGEDTVVVGHIVKRGPRAGKATAHRIYFASNVVKNIDNGVVYRLARVNVDSASDGSDIDAMIASIKAEREKAKAEYDAIVRAGDERIAALLAKKLGSVGI